MKYINNKNKNAFIVAIDAAVTEQEKDENKIFARNKPIKPRLGLGDDLGSIGDVSIIFTVDKRNTCCLSDSMRLGDVYKGVSKTVNELLLLEKLLILELSN